MIEIKKEERKKEEMGFEGHFLFLSSFFLFMLLRVEFGHQRGT